MSQTDGDNNNNNGHNTEIPQDVFHQSSREGDVATRFTTPGANMSDAITATYIASDNELNNIIRLWHKAQKWHVQAAINDLLIKVNGARSKDGRSILAMLMSSAQILVPEWGAEVSKKSRDNMETIKKNRERRNNGSEGKDDDVD
jgi:hypothetical protein